MNLHVRKTIRFGPLRFNVSNSGISTTLRLGWWSWNSRTRKHRVNLPGPLYLTSGKRKKP